MLSGGVLAALLGPVSGTYTQHLFPYEYVGSYCMMAIYAICNQIVLYSIDFPSPGGEDDSDEESLGMEGGQGLQLEGGKEDFIDVSQEMSPRESDSSSQEARRLGEKEGVRSLLQIVSRPLFVLACSTATVAHTVMVMFMSVFTIAMDQEGFSFGDISTVMLCHLLAMFLPGFVTGSLISAWGTFAVSVVGAVVFAVAIGSLLHASSLWSYSVGMVCVGLAWNLSFSAGTVMLTSCYTVGMCLSVYICVCVSVNVPSCGTYM